MRQCQSNKYLSFILYWYQCPVLLWHVSDTQRHGETTLLVHFHVSVGSVLKTPPVLGLAWAESGRTAEVVTSSCPNSQRRGHTSRHLDPPTLLWKRGTEVWFIFRFCVFFTVNKDWLPWPIYSFLIMPMVHNVQERELFFLLQFLYLFHSSYLQHPSLYFN